MLRLSVLCLLVISHLLIHMHTSTAEQIKLDIKEHRLENGLRLLMHHDHSSPIISFQVWYDVGSINERPGITGISHLFEHMMFKGSKNVDPEEHSRIIQRNGGTDNAFTTEDMTAYFENLPSSQIELAVKLEADRMAHLRLTAETLASERQVVKEERRMRTKEELDSAKSYFVGHFPLSMETPAQIAAKIIDQEFYGLPEDYLDKYLDNIKAVSMADIDRTIKRVLEPGNVVITLVSRAEDIMEEAKALGDVELKEP